MRIKHKKLFLGWALLHLFILVNVLTWETDYHHLENDTFAMIGLTALNLPVGAAINYTIDKYDLLNNTPAPGLNPWSRPKESDMIFIKIKWSVTILVFMLFGYFQWFAFRTLYIKIAGRRYIS